MKIRLKVILITILTNLLFSCIPTTATITYSINDTIISEYIYDLSRGMSESRHSITQLNNTQVYAICTQGESNDGWLRTIYVNNTNGIIHQLVDFYEYDSSDGMDANIIHIPNSDKYAICYNDVGSSLVKIVTITIYENGSIIKNPVDTISLTHAPYASAGDNIDFIRLTTNVYCTVFRNASANAGWLETTWINTTGTINDTILDKKRICPAIMYPTLEIIDTDTIAVAYTPFAASGYLLTRNITSAGIISSSNASLWSFDSAAVSNANPDIYAMGNNIFMMAYGCSGSDGELLTFTIADTGVITKSNISSYEYDQTDGLYPFISYIDTDIYSISYQGTSGDGWLIIINVTSNGLIGATIDKIEFDTVDSIGFTYANIISIGNDFLLISYTTTSNYGMLKTVKLDGKPSIVYTEDDGTIDDTPTMYTNGRKLARDSNGYLYTVFYRDGNTGGNNIVCAKSMDNGTTWTHTNVSGNGANAQTTPCIATDSSDRLHVAWEGWTGTKYKIYYSRSTDSGASWSAAITISTIEYNQRYVSIAVNSTDSIFLAWSGYHAGSTAIFQVRFSKSINSGVTWSSPINLTNTGGNKYNPCISIDLNDKIHIVTHVEPSPYQIQYGNSTDSGATWSVFRNITNVPTYSQSNPNMIVDASGVIHIAWTGCHAYSTTYSQVRYIRSINSGLSFSNPINITIALRNHEYASLTYDRTGMLHILFFSAYVVGTGGTISTIFYCDSPDDGFHWTVEKPLYYCGNTVTESKYANFIYAIFPNVSGNQTNIPYQGYAFVYGVEQTYVMYSCNTTLYWAVPSSGCVGGLVVANNSVNTTGPIEYAWSPFTGVCGEWWVWVNLTGETTPLTVVNNTVGTTGNYTTSLNSTGHWVTLNFVGGGGAATVIVQTTKRMTPYLVIGLGFGCILGGMVLNFRRRKKNG